MLRERAHVPDGHFVLGRVYSAALERVAERAVDGGVALPPPSTGDLASVRKEGRSVHDALYIDGKVYIRVLSEIPAPSGKNTGYFEGVYLLDPATLWRLAGDAFLAIAICVTAVVFNMVFLYPTFLSLDRQLLRRSQDLLDANVSMLEVLGSAIAKRDSDTSHHNYRVTIYAAKLGEELSLPADEMRTLIKGAFLHDVGKVAIRDAILLKPARLTAEEFEEIKTHVGHGLDVVRRSKWLAEAEAVVGGHHEKWDGSGYPKGLKAEQIPRSARIFAIADVFDALTSRRPYKPVISFEQAWDVLEEGRSHHFDPILLGAFRRISVALYRQLADCDEVALKRALSETITKYFA